MGINPSKGSDHNHTTIEATRDGSRTTKHVTANLTQNRASITGMGTPKAGTPENNHFFGIAGNAADSRRKSSYMTITGILGQQKPGFEEFKVGGGGDGDGEEEEEDTLANRLKRKFKAWLDPVKAEESLAYVGGTGRGNTKEFKFSEGYAKLT